MSGKFLLSFLKGLFQVAILTSIIYLIHCRFIQNSQAEQLLRGVFIVLVLFIGLWGLASVLQLSMLVHVFAASIQILFIGLIVIFQPELRRLLLMLGQGELFGSSLMGEHSSEVEKTHCLIETLGESVHFLSKSKRGALIVLEPHGNTGTNSNYLEVGTMLDSTLSTELLLTIFHQNTPLHDGAVVISANNRIIAAGVLLPLTEDPKLSWQYGTRHRAAIGLTEVSESMCVVVSEETGNISLVRHGKLEKITSQEELKTAITNHYSDILSSSGKLSGATLSDATLGIGKRLSAFFLGDSQGTRRFDKKNSVLKEQDEAKSRK
jgi:diadenylate cyclase